LNRWRRPVPLRGGKCVGLGRSPVSTEPVGFHSECNRSAVEPFTGILRQLFGMLFLPRKKRRGISVRRRFRETMGDTMGRSLSRIHGEKRGERLHRKWNMDYRSCTGHDNADRVPAKCFDNRVWTNYSESQHDSIKGNAYIELMLVLPILVLVFLGLATVVSLFMGNMAVSQAAELGAVAWSNGQNSADVDGVVNQTLSSEGYTGSPTTSLASDGDIKTVTVTIPMHLFNLGRAGSVSASRSVTSIAAPPTTSPTTSSPSGGGGSGGGGYIYHHFPMW